MENFKKALGGLFRGSFLTGSMVICNPPVIDTDLDVCLLVTDLHAACDNLEADGWDVSQDDPLYHKEGSGEIEFITARKGSGISTNLIIYQCEKGYAAFMDATAVAQYLNLLEKVDRVMLFRAVLGGRNPSSDSDIFA
jgi:hypothetical protein